MTKNERYVSGVAAMLVLAGATASVDSAEGKHGDRLLDRGKGQVGSINSSVRSGVNSTLLLPPGMDGDVANFGRLHYMPGVPIPTTYGYELNLIDDLKTLALKNVDLQKKLDATRTQVAALVEQNDSLKQGCVDATAEDGCPAGCTSDNVAKDDKFILCSGASCLF